MVGPSNMHLTLRFLGEIEEETAKEVGSRLFKALATQEPFVISTDLIEFKRDRTLWLDIKDSPALNALKDAIDTELERAGIKNESRPFSPHLTLMRVKGSERIKRIKRILRAIDRTLEMDIKVTGVTLVKSKLGAGAPTHSVIRECAFGK